MKKYFILVVLLFTLAPVYAYPATAQPALPWQDGSATVSDGSIYQRFQTSITQLQKQLKERMAELSRSLKQGDKTAMVWLLGLAFLYGVIHAIGPGHGKALVASYLLTQRSSPCKGIALAALAALLHGFSAILVVLLIYYLALGRLSSTFNAWSGNLQILAYALISAIGLFLVCSKTLGLLRKDKGKGCHVHSPDGGQSWWLLLALGLVPCPGTMIVLLFFLSQKMLWIGVLMAVTMAMGMALTLSGVGFCALLAQTALERRAARATQPFFTLAHDLLGISGAVLVLALGLLLLHGAWV